MQTLLNLLAGVSLLVWGTHLVRTGILRLYGGDLRRILRRSVSRRPAAFFAGLGVTGLIQSSTATALIVASFAGQGLIGTAPALAVMLGADVGTALVTVLLSFDLSWLAPLLIFIGIVMYLSSQAGAAGRFGQILIGLGLTTFALQWISVAAHPVVQASGVQVIFASLTGDVLLDMLVAALVTVLCYSSLAVVLLVATLASLHVIALPVALGLVLGANLGSGVLGMLSTLRSPPEARRVTLGNFIFKLIGCVLAFPFVGHLESWISGLGIDPSREVVLFHLFFNIALALLLVFWTEKIAKIAERMLPTRPASEDPAKPRHLDPSALDTPGLAIACAAREAMRIGDVIEQMLSGMLTVLTTNDRALAQDLRNMDDVVEESLRAAALSDEVKDKLKQSAYGLSGGQQQRLCIARTIAVKPEVILMDEPCSALDPIATARIEDLMMELKRDYTIVIVTHNMQQAARVADRTAFFTAEAAEGHGDRTGHLVEFDLTTKIFSNPADSRTEDYISGRFG